MLAASRLSAGRTACLGASLIRAGASPDCRWRLARALLASRVARASCPWTRAKAHGRDAHATCATDNREMCPTGRVEDKGRQAAGSRLFSKPAGNSPEIRNTVGR
jgi:hypothetical protein